MIQCACCILSFIQTSTTQESSLSGLLWRASPLAKLVLFLLAIFSLASWAIIAAKFLATRRALTTTDEFLSRFRRRQKLSDVYTDSEELKDSPVARVFQAAYDEIGNQMNAGRGVYSIDAVGRILQAATIEEVSSMERSLSWLATTANASPFIGLFGTVVGIIIAFQGLSAGASSSSIQAVAPGIAEALIATAAGIGTAVPASIFYNLFLSRIKNLTAIIDRFNLELLNVVERHYLKASV